MINTEVLTEQDIAKLNYALRGAKVTDEDIRQIAAELKLGEATVRRWFDATNDGNYSPGIPAAAVGKEDYLLEDNGDIEFDVNGELAQSPTKYKDDPYLNDEVPDGDIVEDVGSDEGIVDPSEGSLHERILLSALLTPDGYTRESERGTTFTGETKQLDLPVFATLYDAVEAAENIISGGYSRFLYIGWASLKVGQTDDGFWYLDAEYYTYKEGDISP